MKKFSKELNKELAEHGEWAKPSFGGGVAGMVYGCLVGMGICLYYTAGVFASMAAIPSLGLFWVLCKYDKTLVSIWNEREKERVIAQWVVKNSDKIVDGAMQPLDYVENLDGTNEDE